MLKVNETFISIQGEGPFAGRPATFIRFSGCNLNCDFCDTDHSHSTDMTLEMLVGICKRGPQLVVLTGGEPAYQSIMFLNVLVDMLARIGKYVQIETNGTIKLPRSIKTIGAVIVCSPKPNTTLALDHVDYYKYLFSVYTPYHPVSGLPIDCPPPINLFSTAAIPRNIYIQPLDEKVPACNIKNRAACVKHCIKYGFTLSLQQHKILGIK